MIDYGDFEEEAAKREAEYDSIYPRYVSLRC